MPPVLNQIGLPELKDRHRTPPWLPLMRTITRKSGFGFEPTQNNWAVALWVQLAPDPSCKSVREAYHNAKSRRVCGGNKTKTTWVSLPIR